MERIGQPTERTPTHRLLPARAPHSGDSTAERAAMLRTGAVAFEQENNARYLRSLVSWVLLDDAWLEPLLSSHSEDASDLDESADPDYHDGWSEIRPRFARLVMPPRQ
jgi:hypothetical protein